MRIVINDLNEAINEDRKNHGKKELKFDGEPKKNDGEDDEDYFDDGSGKG